MPKSPGAHFLCSTARIWQDISSASFCSCKLFRRSDECVLLPGFHVQPDIFAVMSCCVVALILFSSNTLIWSADSLYLVKWHIKDYECRRIYILCQQTSLKRWLETWIWCQNVTSRTAHTKYKWPPYATEWNPPWKFSAYATACSGFAIATLLWDKWLEESKLECFSEQNVSTNTSIK